MALTHKAPTSFVVNLAREQDVLTFQQLGEEALHKAITIADETAEVHAKSQLLRAHVMTLRLDVDQSKRRLAAALAKYRGPAVDAAIAAQDSSSAILSEAAAVAASAAASAAAAAAGDAVMSAAGRSSTAGPHLASAGAGAASASRSSAERSY